MSDAPKDLTVSRFMAAPPEIVWRAWAEPKLFEEWFAPKPAKATAVTHEFRTGGAFAVSTTSEDGTVTPSGERCFVEITPNTRIVFTDALRGGWRPNPQGTFTGIVTLTPEGNGTRFAITARHGSEAARAKDIAAGFVLDWAKALDQLGVLVERLMADDRAGANSPTS